MWPNPQFPAHLVTFTEEILIGKLHFLCNEWNIMLCIINSTKLCIHSAIFHLSHKVHGGMILSVLRADPMASSQMLFFNISIVCSTSSFCLFISFISSSFNFLFRSFSDFPTISFLLSWASFCLWRAFLHLSYFFWENYQHLHRHWSWHHKWLFVQLTILPSC